MCPLGLGPPGETARMPSPCHRRGQPVGLLGTLYINCDSSTSACEGSSAGI